MKKTIINFINKYKIIILGFLMFSLYIWFRFIRTRLPKDIPFFLSVLGFFILVEICCIYGYIVYKMISQPKEPNMIIEELVSLIYKPLEDFDYFWKHLKFIRKKYKKFILYLAKKFNNIIIKTNIFYFMFAIFPRLLLIFTLFIDIFFFHKLSYIYKIILIGILLFLNKYIIFSFKTIKSQLLDKFKLYVNTVQTAYVFGPHLDCFETNDEEEEDEEDDFIPQTMSLIPEKFVLYQTNSIVYKKTTPTFIIADYAFPKIREKYNIQHDSFSSNIRDIVEAKCLKNLDTIIQISILLEHYSLTSNTHKDLILIRQLIFINYLICWCYILLSSIPSLRIQDFIIVFNSTWLNGISNPFL